MARTRMAAWTWAESRQKAWFDMARVYWRIAQDSLRTDLDAVERGITPSYASLEWTREHAKKHAEQARAFEDTAHAEGIASARTESNLARYHDEYSALVSKHVALRKALYPGAGAIWSAPVT